MLGNLIVERMREIRESYNHTQEYLIETLHLHIDDYESGKSYPTLLSIAIFCEFYHLSLYEFFGPMGGVKIIHETIE